METIATVLLSLIPVYVSSTVTVYSSCNSIDINGLYYIQPLENGNVIPVICNNKYTMIDPSLNFESITSYLSSWDYSRLTSNIFSSELNDFVNWREWWLPADTDTLFTISPQCNTCLQQQYNDNNIGYYMSNHYFCFKLLSNNMCDLADNDNNNYNIYCNACDDPEHDSTNWSSCYGIQLDVDHIIDNNHDNCVHESIMARPSMVKDRSFCTCYRPLIDVQYTVSTDDLPVVYLPLELRDTIPYIDANIIFSDASDDTNIVVNNDHDIYYLTNDDFLCGTYRITKSGEYILTEDIIINFNAPTEEDMNDINWSPNSYDNDNLYWWPTVDQSINDYPGMNTYHGVYTLGFFAGITIEVDNVIINLNQHSIEMHQQFYLQQRFFSIIELSNRNFIPPQGAANLGLNDEFYASHVIIKDGRLGKTSHHGIHGNNANDVIIQNMIINQFDVAGIGLNGGKDIQILDTIVGPQNNEIPVLGRYTHARAILPRLKEFVDKYDQETVTFYDRDEISVSELADRLIKQMDMIYYYVIDDSNEYDDNDLEWIAAQKLFLNPTGLMDAGSSYGIVLNGEGSATLAIGQRIENAENVLLSNVEIQGIYNDVIEKVKSVTINDDDGAIRGMLSDPIDWEAVVDQIDNPLQSKYIGDAYTDIIFAINKLQSKQDWYYLHCMRITEDIEEFVFNGNSEKFISNSIDINCNTDIQMHTSKGAIGLRIDGVQNTELSNIYIHDIINYSPLGSGICGEYDVSSISKEDIDIQYGYTGNRAQGLIIDYGSGIFNSIDIENIESKYGSSWGISIYKGSEITLNGNINVKNINAGSDLLINDVEQLSSPNLSPKACSIEGSPDANIIIDNDVIISDTVIGYDLCSDNVQIGQCANCYLRNDINQKKQGNIHLLIANWFTSSIVIATLLSIIWCIKSFANTYLSTLKRIDGTNELTPLL